MEEEPRIGGVFGAIAGLLGMSVIAGALVAALGMPAIAVSTGVASSAVGYWDVLPDYITLGEQSNRTRIFATQNGEPVQIASIYEQNREQVEYEGISQSALDAAIAAEDKDYASSNMLVWFIDEQVEEEESARGMITACEAVEGNKFGMYMLDKELAARTYSQAAPLASSND